MEDVYRIHFHIHGVVAREAWGSDILNYALAKHRVGVREVLENVIKAPSFGRREIYVVNDILRANGWLPAWQYGTKFWDHPYSKSNVLEDWKEKLSDARHGYPQRRHLTPQERKNGVENPLERMRNYLVARRKAERDRFYSADREGWRSKIEEYVSNKEYVWVQEILELALELPVLSIGSGDSVHARNVLRDLGWRRPAEQGHPWLKLRGTKWTRRHLVLPSQVKEREDEEQGSPDLRSA